MLHKLMGKRLLSPPSNGVSVNTPAFASDYSPAAHFDISSGNANKRPSLLLQRHNLN